MVLRSARSVHTELIRKRRSEPAKNLRRVFDAAKKSRAVLFFDEADALFGKHTEVKDDHDHYANIETNYLLQRIEGYVCVAILAAGNRTEIDNTFSRGFHFVIRVPCRSEPSARYVRARILDPR